MTDTLERLATAAERIADALDAIAGLMAAPAAVKGTGPELDPLNNASIIREINRRNAEPDADGWVEWAPPPIGITTTFVPDGLDGANVSVRYRDGEVFENGRAVLFDWRNTSENWNVVAYKVLP